MLILHVSEVVTDPLSLVLVMLLVLGVPFHRVSHTVNVVLWQVLSYAKVQIAASPVSKHTRAIRGSEGPYKSCMKMHLSFLIDEVLGL